MDGHKSTDTRTGLGRQMIRFKPSQGVKNKISFKNNFLPPNCKILYYAAWITNKKSGVI
jgi:hypothetical protein